MRSFAFSDLLPLLNGPRAWLLLFAAFLLLCMLPAWYGLRHDSRTIRGVRAWVKPLKFLAALALFSATTAVLMLATQAPSAQPALRGIALLLIGTASFEAGYISLQASRGEASHYNTADRLHLALTAVMALGAVGLTASQAWLAVVIATHDERWSSSVPLLGVVTGLMLTFVLATVSGFMLGARQAPAGTGLPLVGWHRRADLRPAHFLAVHAQQGIPLLGVLAERLWRPAPHAAFALLTVAYLLAWAWSVRIELAAAP